MRGTPSALVAALVMCARVAAADDTPAPIDIDSADESGLTDLSPTSDVDDASTRRNPLVWTDLYTTHCPPRHRADRALHLELSVGALGGGYRVGAITGGVFAFHATAGARTNHWALLADYALLSFTETPGGDTGGRDARIHRIGLLARYSLLSASDTYPTSHADLYLEAGVGHERLRWYDGGRLARNDVRVGFGGDAAFWFGRHDRHKLGVWISLALVIAPAPTAKQFAPTCAGPCDAPTRPDPYDLMYWFDVGIPFH